MTENLVLSSILVWVLVFVLVSLYSNCNIARKALLISMFWFPVTTLVIRSRYCSLVFWKWYFALVLLDVYYSLCFWPRYSFFLLWLGYRVCLLHLVLCHLSTWLLWLLIFYHNSWILFQVLYFLYIFVVKMIHVVCHCR